MTKMESRPPLDGQVSRVNSHRQPKPLLSILWLAAVSLLVQFALDALAFRTPFYSSLLEPESFAGSYELTLRNERSRILTRPKHILVFGDSSIAEGFSAPLANALIDADKAGDNQWFFSSVGTPAATPRAWFYLLRHLDPLGKRYNVIVLPLNDYDDADGIEPPDVDIEADRDLDLNRLVVRLRLADLFEFPFTYRDHSKKLWALSGTALKGVVYSHDVQEFLRDPTARLQKVKQFDAHSREWKDNYPGHAGSVEGIGYSPAQHEFTFPPTFSPAMRKALVDRYHPERMRISGYRRAYRKKWLGGIIEHYRLSNATIVLFRVPIRPIPLQASVVPNGETFIQFATNNPHVLALDKNLFADLETPSMFFDIYHLNDKGRAAFTPRLARAVIERVNQFPRANP